MTTKLEGLFRAPKTIVPKKIDQRQRRAINYDAQKLTRNDEHVSSFHYFLFLPLIGVLYFLFIKIIHNVTKYFTFHQPTHQE